MLINMRPSCFFVPFLAAVTLLLTPLSYAQTSQTEALTEDNDSQQEITRAWAISQFGAPEYADGLAHFPYVNPKAPKGGKVVLGAFGTFDTFNAYVQKGEFPYQNINIIYDTLMVGSKDEVDALYGLIAEYVEYPEDKSWATFTIREGARYHDGKPIRAEDFVYALEVIRDEEHGRPFYQSFFESVESAEALNDRQVRFNFNTKHQMKPITIVAELSPLPVHHWKDSEVRDITEATLEPPLSSGPYKIKAVDSGRSITYERVDDYWAKDLPVNIGRYNFDEIRYDYYKDLTVAFEAFKAGEIDFRSEPSAKRWVQEYNFDAVSSNDVVIREPQVRSLIGMRGYFFNVSKDKFKDINVRKAIVTLYDFEAIQRTLLFGKYKRINSNFPDSDYAATGLPSDAEKALLTPFVKQLPAGVLDQEYQLPVSDGSGRDRKQLREALSLFKQAGYELKGGNLLSTKTGEQLSVELMTAFPESQRLALPYIENMKRAGIDASIRLVDQSQWRNRIHDYDFDLWVGGLNFFPPPGTELRSFFGSESAKIRGGNSGGIQNPVVDALIEAVIEAKTEEQQFTAMRALDRVLLWNYYAVPTYFKDEAWIAYWDRFDSPERVPFYGLGFVDLWWIDEQKEQALDR